MSFGETEQKTFDKIEAGLNLAQKLLWVLDYDKALETSNKCAKMLSEVMASKEVKYDEMKRFFSVHGAEIDGEHYRRNEVIRRLIKTDKLDSDIIFLNSLVQVQKRISAYLVHVGSTESDAPKASYRPNGFITVILPLDDDKYELRAISKGPIPLFNLSIWKKIDDKLQALGMPTLHDFKLLSRVQKVEEVVDMPVKFRFLIGNASPLFFIQNDNSVFAEIISDYDQAWKISEAVLSAIAGAE